MTQDDFRNELQAQKLQALGQLAGGVAHDFNNILSIIEGYAKMLDRQLTQGIKPDEMHAQLRHIMTATQRGAGLTRQLLAFGRQKIIGVTQCDLVKTVTETQNLLKPLVTKRIKLSVTVPRHAVIVPADPEMVSQILVNLVINARDAITGSGEIWIDVVPDQESHDGTAKLVVTDNGSGIPAKIATRIFDPFFTTKEQGKGTGLGLSMAAGYMQQIGGGIHYDTAPQNGACFTLIFPLKPAVKNAMPHHSVLQDAQAPHLSLATKTILVVDDEEVLLPALEFQLRDLGLKVLKAANADSALIVQHNYPGTIDLLLADIVMPDVNGVQLAEMLQRERPDMGVVFMSGYADRTDITGKVAQLPDNALLLPKPLPFNELSPILQKALHRIRDIKNAD